MRGNSNVGLNRRLNKEDKKVHYAILKGLGIVALVATGLGALGAGVGLALGAFGISMGIPVVGSALVTAGSWLATAIPALGAFGVALPIALGAIAGIGVAALAIFGIYKFVKSLRTSTGLPPKNQINGPENAHEPPKQININKSN